MTHTYDYFPATGVVHITYSRDVETPWRGIGPLQAAGLTGRLAAETLAALADESSGPRGHLIGIPVDGDDPTVAALKPVIAALAGKAALVQTGDWGGNESNGRMVLKPERLGPEPTAALVELFKPSFPIWLNIPLSKSSAFFEPLSICETLAVGMAIITP